MTSYGLSLFLYTYKIDNILFKSWDRLILTTVPNKYLKELTQKTTLSITVKITIKNKILYHGQVLPLKKSEVV